MDTKSLIDNGTLIKPKIEFLRLKPNIPYKVRLISNPVAYKRYFTPRPCKTGIVKDGMYLPQGTTIRKKYMINVVDHYDKKCKIMDISFPALQAIKEATHNINKIGLCFAGKSHFEIMHFLLMSLCTFANKDLIGPVVEITKETEVSNFFNQRFAKYKYRVKLMGI